MGDQEVVEPQVQEIAEETHSPLKWLVVVVSLLAVVALLVWGDRERGVDDRDTDPPAQEASADV